MNNTVIEDAVYLILEDIAVEKGIDEAIYEAKKLKDFLDIIIKENEKSLKILSEDE